MIKLNYEKYSQLWWDMQLWDKIRIMRNSHNWEILICNSETKSELCQIVTTGRYRVTMVITSEMCKILVWEIWSCKLRETNVQLWNIKSDIRYMWNISCNYKTINSELKNKLEY